ncbi:MAG: DUF3299 domain-containing protein [Bacteroidia bacterium]|nr:DUF3299 domain-containing protein [Bacteroidia bacterium]
MKKTLTLLISFFLTFTLLTSCDKGEENVSSEIPEGVMPKAFTAKEAKARNEKLEKTSNTDNAGDLSVMEGYKSITWEDLSKVTFEDKFYEEINALLLFPTFSDEVKELKGKRVAIKGYVIPLAPGRYVLSENPFSSCFFCGNAGPESVLELELVDSSAIYFSDEYMGFAGVLDLNDSDINSLNYIFRNAVPVKMDNK